MNKQTIFILILFSISFISAITIYSGESVTIELEKPFNYYSVIGNSTEVILNIIQNGNEVTITPDKYSLNDSYEIVFFDIEEKIINVYSSGGSSGGSSSTKYVYRNVTQFVDRNNTIEIEKEIEVEKEILRSSGWSWFWFFGFIVLLVILFYIWFINKDEDVYIPQETGGLNN